MLSSGLRTRLLFLMKRPTPMIPVRRNQWSGNHIQIWMATGMHLFLEHDPRISVRVRPPGDEDAGFII
ncbi:hypothetical protein DPEC_G00230240 [Dallia pectoralis]|uniref:Uncharacterized protein n=1 Tax=Dallia pectoralis TaxID=75939 RepID=A0ACC2G1P2_DALPE|nr:hypothetical protein DPEC_G00230240 [Dallia pectoralis]